MARPLHDPFHGWYRFGRFGCSTVRSWCGRESPARTGTAYVFARIATMATTTAPVEVINAAMVANRVRYATFA